MMGVYDHMHGHRVILHDEPAVLRFTFSNWFFGKGFARFEFVFDCECETAYFDGEKFAVNPDFWFSLTQKQKDSLCTHEVLHWYCFHLSRRNGRDPYYWNVAADYVVNGMIRRNGGEVIENGFDDPKFDGMGAEDIFDALPKEEKDKPKDAPGSKGGDGEDDKGQPKKGNGPSSPKKGNGPKNPYGEISDAKLTPEKKERMEASARATIAQAVQAGNLPGALAEMFKKFGESVVNWKEVFADFVIRNSDQTDYSLGAYNTKTSWCPDPDQIFYSMEGEELPTIAVVLDTSGSITTKQAEDFLGEVNGILQSANVLVMQVDTKVQSVQEFEKGVTLQNFEVKGNGGTDFRPAFDWFRENGVRPEALVYFTDGECSSFPAQPDYPVLWMVRNPYHPGIGETFPEWAKRNVVRVVG